jgi:hypothetical protein
LVVFSSVKLMIGVFLGQDPGCSQGDGGKQEQRKGTSQLSEFCGVLADHQIVLEVTK